MAKKRAAGGGRKEADHQVRLREMARLVLDGSSTSPLQAARQVATRVIALGAAYDWQGQPPVHSVDTLARRLRDQWARPGRAETLIAAEKAERQRGKEIAAWHQKQALQKFLSEIGSALPFSALQFAPEQRALAEFGRSLQRAAGDSVQHPDITAILGCAGASLVGRGAAGTAEDHALALAIEKLLGKGTTD